VIFFDISIFPFSTYVVLLTCAAVILFSSGFNLIFTSRSRGSQLKLVAYFHDIQINLSIVEIKKITSSLFLFYYIVKFFSLIQKLLSKIFVPITWTLIIIILLAMPGSMLPKEEGFAIPNFDKFVHSTVFGMMVFFWCFYFNTKKYSSKKLALLFFLAFFSANALGIGMEFVQRCCIPFRDFDEADMIFDMIGAGISYGICNIFLLGEKNSQ